MTRPIRPGGVELRVFKPDNDTTTPDFVVGGPDGDPGEIVGATVTRSLGPFKDQSKFAVENRGGRYRTGAETITSGDRVEFYVDLGGEAGAWGAGVWGRGTWGDHTDGVFARRLTGVVRNPKVSLDGAGASTLSFTAEDFVGFVLAARTVERGFEERQAAGASGSIINWIVRDKCPEIDRSRIGTIDDRLTMRFNAENVLKAVRKIVKRGDVALRSDGRALVVEPRSGLSDPANLAFELAPDDWGTGDWEANDDDTANHVRVDGGTSEASLDKQETQSDYRTVTKSSRITHQLAVPKSEVSSLEVWTDPTRTGSGDGIVVRLQKDDGGAPLDPATPELDLARKTLASDFLEVAGYTTFGLAGNNVLDDQPWLLIEGDDSDDGSGQDVGIDALTGEPTYRAYYPYPVSSRLRDPDSIAEFRRREAQMTDNSLESLQAVGEAAEGELRERSALEKTFEFDAQSTRAHALAPGDAVDIDIPTAGAAGRYALTRRKDTYADGQLATEVTLQDAETI
jgi:hypothetical protein